jgi:hypothetical protein
MSKVEQIDKSGCHPDDRGSYFSVNSTRKVYIDKWDMTLIDKIRKLPVHTRIAIMDLSYEQVQEYMQNKKMEAIRHLITLLKRKWFWRETGEVADFEYRGIFPGTDMTVSQLRRKLRSKRLPDIKLILQITDFLTGDRAEVYIKN